MAIGEVGELHLPFFLAGLLVERDAAPVHGANEDHAVADGNAAAIGREQHLLVNRIELRLVAPDRLAGFAVERRDLVSRRNRVNYAVDDNRRFLQAHGNVATVSDPGNRKLADIVLVDLIERTISPGVGSPIVLRPVVRVFGARFGRESDTHGTQ